jgi:hydrogenase maturation protein HypF
VWGCEALVVDGPSYERVAHLVYVAMPGGAQAIKEPWRMGAVYLDRAFGRDAADLDPDFVRRTGDRWGTLLQMTREGINSPETSSAGRLFDAVAALCGVRDRVTYEGQAAAELEQLADPAEKDRYPCAVGRGIIDGSDLVGAAAGDLAKRVSAATVAARFHNGLAHALVQVCTAVREERDIGVVALSGGTFQNLLLLERVSGALQGEGFEVLVHRRVPPNDGGISLGQAVVASYGA